MVLGLDKEFLICSLPQTSKKPTTIHLREIYGQWISPQRSTAIFSLFIILIIITLCFISEINAHMSSF